MTIRKRGSRERARRRHPDKDRRYGQFRKTYEESEDYDSEWAPYAIADRIIADYLKAFKAELEKEFMTD